MRLLLPTTNPHKRHRFPAEIISHAVWLYFRLDEATFVHSIQSSDHTQGVPRQTPLESPALMAPFTRI
jgi:hypothetical protein